MDLAPIGTPRSEALYAFSRAQPVTILNTPRRTCSGAPPCSPRLLRPRAAGRAGWRARRRSARATRCAVTAARARHPPLARARASAPVPPDCGARRSLRTAASAPATPRCGVIFPSRRSTRYAVTLQVPRCANFLSLCAAMLRARVPSYNKVCAALDMNAHTLIHAHVHARLLHCRQRSALRGV